MRQLTFAARMLMKTPFVTTVAVLSLGLGIGANTAIFALFNQILLRPLPVAAPNELVNLAAPGMKNGSTSSNNSGDSDTVFSYPMYLDLQRDQQSFTGIAAHRIFGANIGYEGQTLLVDGILVSGNYFDVLGLRPATGRLIQPDDTATVGSTAVAVLSEDYWVSRFKADTNVVGKTIVINGQPLSVVGVAPHGFDGTTRGTRAKVFVPITLRGTMELPFNGFAERNNYWAYLFARLKPGVSMETALTGLNGPYARILQEVELPLQSGMKDTDKPKFTSKRLTMADGRRGQSYIFTQAGTPLTILQVVTFVVLLIACANVANLLLARAAGRAGEMAVRLSIGASRGQLIRQLLLESCLLAALGGVAGLLFLSWTVGLITSYMSFGTVDPAVTRLNWGVMLFAAGLALGTGVLFGIFPAFHATKLDLATTLKGESGRSTGARSAAFFRTSLVVVQISLSMGLLACAGLFGKSLFNVSRVDLGVNVERVVMFGLNPQRNGYTVPRAQEMFQQVIARLSAMPGVTSVSAARVPLISNSNSSTGIDVEGYVQTPEERRGTSYNEVAPRFFETVGMPLITGRDFTDADALGAPKVAIVNEAFVRRYKLNANPVGKRFRRGGSEKDPYDIEIVGLVRDAKYSQVRQAIPPVFFVPYRQNDRIAAMMFYSKVAGDPSALVTSVRPLIASMDPNLPIQRLQTLEQNIADNISQDRQMSVLSAMFAGLATVLAAIGLYGVLAYTVSQRTREFGLRMALGAAPGSVQSLVLRQVLWMTLAGGAIGLGLAIYAGYLAKALLFEMGNADPTVMATSVGTLAIVALVAGFVPSRRASRVDPMRALRCE